MILLKKLQKNQAIQVTPISHMTSMNLMPFGTKHGSFSTKNFFKYNFVLLLLTLCTSSFAQMSVQETLPSGHSPWKFSFFSLVNSELGSVSQGGGRVSSYNYLTLGYRYGLDSRFALRLPFTLASAGFDNFNSNKVQEQEMLLQDIFFSVSDYNLVLLPGDISVFWEGRVYLPTSKHSEQIKMITRLRNDFILNKQFSTRWSLEYISKLNYYYQSQTAYKNTFEGADGYEVTTESLTRSYMHDSWFNLWYSVVPGTGLGWRIGWEDNYYNKSKILNREKDAIHDIKFGPTFRFNVDGIGNFIVNVSDIVDNAENRSELGQFKSENTELTLLAFISL